VLPFVGLVLAMANWNARPQTAWVWAAAIAMLVVMLAVLRRARIATRRAPLDVSLGRRFASISGAVVFGALIIIIPLAVTLAHAYGVVDDPDSGRRATNIIIGAYLVVIGNSMPKRIPPRSSMVCDGARAQAFQRFAGWTWVLCGLGFVIAWLELPIDIAQPVSSTIVIAAVLLTLVQILRYRRSCRSAPGLS
jgi:hypothetical protein